ncbi:MAG TPA: PDZ domain-containing protein [Planctomycetaceae bacterium]|nr:PDZ domain-containing protein [Planctomycetaceae bacterium]
MRTLRHATTLFSALVALPLTAYAQQPGQPSPGQAPAAQSSQTTGPSSTTTTTTTTSPAPSGNINTDTNSQPDMTATGGHANTDVRIRPGVGTLASAMANFSVRTGLEVRPNTMAQVVVQSVRPDSPAARAGVEAGDLITNLNGTEISTMGSFQKLITKQPSQAAYLASFRRGEHNFRAPLGRQLSLMGMTLFPDPADRPIVKIVESASPAERAGFKVGDVITGVDRQDTATMAKLLDFAIPFMRNISQGQGIPFRVVRDGKPLHFSVTRPADADLPQLTPDQERHLRRLANGDEDRSRSQPRTITRQTRTTRTTGGQINSVTGQVPQQYQNGVGVAGGIAGMEGAGLGGVGVVGDGFGGGLGTTGTAGATGTNGTATSAVAVLRGTAGRQTLNPAQQTGTSTTGATGNTGMGVVGFVQIQANIGLNGNGNMASNINPSAPGANPSTGNTTTNTGVNPVTGNAATSTQNPNAAATPTGSQPQTQQQTGTTSTATNGFGNGTTGLGGIGTGLTGTNGVNGATNAANGTTNGVTGTNGMNGTNTGINSGTNGNTPTQSFVSAQISRLPQGTYTLTVNQFGECGDSAGAAPGPSVLTLGTITVNANGQGGLPTQTVNFPPQAFIGRTVSLVAAGGGGGIVGPVVGQSQTANSNVQTTTGIVACGRFTVANQGNSNIGGNQGGFGVGVPGTGFGTGTGTTTGNGTGTGAAPTQPVNPTGTGTTGTGTFPKVPGQLPRPMFP